MSFWNQRMKLADSVHVQLFKFATLLPIYPCPERLDRKKNELDEKVSYKQSP